MQIVRLVAFLQQVTAYSEYRVITKRQLYTVYISASRKVITPMHVEWLAKHLQTCRCIGQWCSPFPPIGLLNVTSDVFFFIVSSVVEIPTS